MKSCNPNDNMDCFLCRRGSDDVGRGRHGDNLAREAARVRVVHAITTNIRNVSASGEVQGQCPRRRGLQEKKRMTRRVEPNKETFFSCNPRRQRHCQVRRQEPGFAEMGWGSTASRLFVEEVLQEDDDPAPAGYHGNIRILLDDVDAVYQAAMVLPDVKILKKLEDRYYGLRDFTLEGRYGLALHFATPLAGFSED